MSEEVTLKGTISYIDQKEGVKAFFYVNAPGKFPRQNGLVVCYGDRGVLKKGMPVLIKGTLKEGTIDCKSIIPSYIDDISMVSFLTLIAKGTGIGKNGCKKILDIAGRDILSMGQFSLEDKLIENSNILKIGTYKIEEFCRKLYSDSTTVCLLEDELKKTGVLDIKDLRMFAHQLYHDYGDDAVDILKKDPYSICVDLGISVVGAEILAKDYGISEFDDVRVVGLIKYSLNNAARNGHTYSLASDVSDYVKTISAGYPYYQVIPDMITSLVIIRSKELCYNDKNKKYVQLAELYNAEKNVAKNLIELLSVESNRTIDVDIEKIKAIESATGFIYGNDQKAAFSMLKNKECVIILTGGPGTGKTAFINGIVAMYRRYFPEDVIKFAAPTGRAAKRLSESVNDTATTIHHLVEYIPYGSNSVAARSRMNPIDANLIIIDESSMIDIKLMSMLLDAVKHSPDCRIIFVGDKDQLPSVDAGNVFGDMIDSEIFPTYVLGENFRQQSGGSIVDNSILINSGNMPVASDDFELIKVSNENTAKEMIIHLMEKHYKRFLPYDTQIIEPIKFGNAGCHAINDIIHKNIIFSDVPDITPEIQVGDKIIFTRNEYMRSCSNDNDIKKDIIPLYVNGDMGIVTEMTDDYIMINEAGDEVEVPTYAKADMDLAYSCTIHKFQGSESKVCIIYLPSSAKKMMTKSLLYTAVTRAKEKVYLIYQDSALEDCIKNKAFVKRRTMLKEYLVA